MTSAEQIFRAVEFRHGPEANQNDIAYLNDENPKYTECDTEKEVSAHERIAHLSGEQAAPRDDGLRPFPSYPGLNREVKQPSDSRDKKARADGKQQEKNCLQPGDNMATKQ